MPNEAVPLVLDSLDAPELDADAYVLDVWGVLWDGIQAYPAAKRCLTELRHRKRRVLLLSNAPRRSSTLAEGLACIGIGENLFDDILTSGDLCRASCEAGIHGLGRNYRYLGLEKDRDLLAGLPFTEVPTLQTADFILNLGMRELGEKASAYHTELAEAARRDLPMLCGNPDQIIVRTDGTLIECAGALARHYQELGGTVHAFGKPLPATYDACLAKLRNWIADLQPGDVLAVGDSLSTDIQGARNAGFRTALVADGIHRDELGITRHGEPPDPILLAALFRQNKVFADAVLPVFRWSPSTTAA